VLRLRVERRPAGEAEVEAALERLDAEPLFFLGVEAGVAGLHSLQATIADAPAFVFRVHADGTELEALDPFGEALLRHPALDEVAAACGRGRAREPLRPLRAFLAAFDGEPEVLLVGALRFEAHRLQARSAGDGDPAAGAHDTDDGERRAPDDTPLGLFVFSPRLLRRDAAGCWQRIELALEGIDARPTDRSVAEPVPATSGAAPADDFVPGGYAAVVARAVERLRREPLVSLTLSQSFRRRVDGVSVARAFQRLRRANPAPAVFALRTPEGANLFGASPDLQLCVNGREVESFPVCGTVARGHGPVGESESLRALLAKEVDAASLAVCTDALRNDLAPLCEPGSLRLVDRRRPMALATVVHTVDRLVGTLREGVDAWDAIVATTAPVMATGTPRAQALAAIGALEASPRGWYGGLVVQVSAAGDALAGTILRAAAIEDGVADVRTGGDLLADSDPAREEHESRIKSVSLWRALGLEVDAALDAQVAGAAGGAVDVATRASTLPRAVALVDAGDPFAAAVAESLEGFGFVLDASAACRVLVGGDAERCLAAARGGLVALGDAAVRVLAASGAGRVVERPRQGRLAACTATDEAPSLPRRAFTALRHSRLALERDAAAEARSGWVVWARDAAGDAIALVHPARRIACLDFRPESLLADEVARGIWRAAIGFVSGGHTMATVTIYHNPACGTSRNALATIRGSGIEPEVVEYLKTPPSADRLAELAAAMGVPVRDLLRRKGTPYDELGLDDPKWTDRQLLELMVRHPILINRPIVVTPLGTRLCRPAELVLDILPKPQP
jgi:arsenate reductase (glutaredoxin)